MDDSSKMQAIMGNDEAEGSPNIAAQGCRDHSDPLVRSQMGYEYLGLDLRGYQAR